MNVLQLVQNINKMPAVRYLSKAFIYVSERYSGLINLLSTISSFMLFHADLTVEENVETGKSPDKDWNVSSLEMTGK